MSDLAAAPLKCGVHGCAVCGGYADAFEEAARLSREQGDIVKADQLAKIAQAYRLNHSGESNV